MKLFHSLAAEVVVILSLVGMSADSLAQQTANYVTKFSTPPNIINSVIYENAGKIGINTTTPAASLDVGTGQLTGGSNAATKRNYIDMSAFSSFGDIDFIYPNGGRGRNAENTFLGTNDIWFQAVPATTAGYGYYETYNGAGTVLGTSNSTPILFRPNRAEKMRLTSSGNLGIGTTSPAYALDVIGAIKRSQNLYVGSTFNNYSAIQFSGSTTTSGWPLMYVRENSSAGASETKIAALFENYGGGVGSAVGVEGVASHGSATCLAVGGFFQAYVDDATNYGAYGTAYGNKVSGTATNIGVRGYASGDGATNIGGWFSAAEGSGTNPTQYGVQIAGPVSGTNRYALYSSATAQSYFAGTVGIGTTNLGTSKLAVCGDVHAISFTTSSGWCDYVFDDQYCLMPLDEVEQHIKSNNHLPGIPSTKEIEENGLNIGDMEVKMMQKIEELTLYVIEQNKKIQKLEKENEAMKVRVSSIEK